MTHNLLKAQQALPDKVKSCQLQIFY